MLTTINTDASWCPQTKVGAYAFWVRSDKFLLKKSGVFRKRCSNPSDAEVKCIINATKLTMRQDRGIKKIIINTDSKLAITVLTGGLVKPSVILRWRPLYKMFKNITHKRGVEVEFRWVKAHSHTGEARNWVNAWCDKEARKQLRNQININNDKEVEIN